MDKIMKLTTMAVLVTTLSGCAVGPDYQSPTQVAGIALLPYSESEQSLNWWRAFDDEQLNQLIAQALLENRTLAKAEANVQRAYAVFSDSANNTWPKATLDSSYQATKNGSVSKGDDGVITRGSSFGANASWDLDLFGKLHRATEAARANATQAELLWQDARLHLISQVATSYGQYRGAQLRLKVAEENLLNLQQSRHIVSVREKAGVASEFELARIDAQLYEVQATIPDFKVGLLVAEGTLSALLAKKPGQLQLNESIKLPKLKHPLALVASENYLRYRPDVASSEQALAASTAEIGVKTADLYPNLSVRGFLGFLSGPGLTIGSSTQSWNIAPSISWQVGDLGSVRARINSANASAKMALAAFEQQVFYAINDMEVSLKSYNFSREQQLSVALQNKASDRAVTIARARYKAGTGEFLELLEAERDLLRSRDKLAQLEQQSFSRLVNVYQNFAGAIVVQ